MVPCIRKRADRAGRVAVAGGRDSHGLARRSYMSIVRVISKGVVLAALGVTAATAQSESHGVAEVVDPAVQRIDAATIQDKDSSAMYALGRMFDEGLGVATDEQLAFQWYSRAV
jgi:TPR repeat protein